jgi:hypothetical protein
MRDNQQKSLKLRVTVFEYEVFHSGRDLSLNCGLDLKTSVLTAKVTYMYYGTLYILFAIGLH